MYKNFSEFLRQVIFRDLSLYRQILW